MKLRTLSIRNRLIALVTLSLILLATISVYFLSMEREQMLTDRKAKLLAVIESARNLTAHYAARAEKGEMSKEQAQEAVRQNIRYLRYEGDNYISIQDLDYKMIEHPARPEMNGKDASDLKDPTGFRISFHNNETAKRDQNEPVEYLWAKPGHNQPVKKLAMSKLFAPWGWVFTTGVYLDDVDAEFNRLATIAAAIIGGAMLMLLILAVLITRSITRPNDWPTVI